MKKPILSILSLFILSTSFAQITIRIGKHDNVQSWTPSMTQNFASVSEAKHYAQEIIDVVGLKPNFEVMASSSVPNAAAVVYGGKRYVLYNASFISQLVRTTGNKWAAVSVLAHEIGHHLNGHTVTGTGSQPAVELEADEFSGFVLRKMGASLSDAQAAMKVIASKTASRTHPAQTDRLTSIARGWQTAEAQASGRDVARVPDMRVPQGEPATTTYPGPSTPQQRTASPTAVLNSRQIIGEVRFSKDPGVRYYVTNRYALVKVRNSRLYTMGKLTRLNSAQYPYMISDGETRLFVDRQGNILSERGQRVGVMTARA